MKLNQIRKKIGFFFSIGSIIRTYRGIRNARRILELGRYRERCRAAGIAIDEGVDIWAHYRDIGAPKNIDPCDLFDAEWFKTRYLSLIPNENPLLHYLVISERRGRYVSAILSPKVVYQKISDHPPLHKSYLLGLMEEYSINKIADIGLNSPVVLKNILGKENEDFFILRDGLTYLKKNNLKYSFIYHIKGINCNNVYKKNPFFGYHLPYYTVLTNVYVVPNTADIIVTTNEVINDELFNSNRLKDTYGDPLKDPKYHDLFCDLVIEKNISYNSNVIEKGIHLTKEYNENYFHFICDLGSKVAIIEERNIFDKNIPFIISGDLHDNIVEFLNIMNVSQRKIIALGQGKTTLVKKLYYLSDITLVANTYAKKADEYVTVLPKPVLQMVRNRVLSVIRGNHRNVSKIAKRIYISRKCGARRVVNEADIEQYLSGRGFKIIDISKLTFAAQVELFYQAELIVAPTGAAMTNLLWCQPNAKVVIFYPSHPFNNISFWKAIADDVGIDVEFLYGKSVGEISILYPHCDYEIDIGAIGKAVDKIEKKWSFNETAS